MSHYPTLNAMGVTSLEQISRYTLQHDNGSDELKIYYRRPDDSPLPHSKKFRFGVTQGESTATLLAAVDELNRLTRVGSSAKPTRAQLADELAQLEQVLIAKMGELKRQLEAWG
ncbi:MAG TPA: DUF3461 family protein [Motiliproteus sp.]